MIPKYYSQDITTLTTELREYHAVAYEIDMLRTTLKVVDPLPPAPRRMR